MHEDQQKHRYYYPRQQPRHNPPLIAPKKSLLELKQKQNEKHNVDPHKIHNLAKTEHNAAYPTINTVDRKQSHPTHECLSFGQVKNNPKHDKSLHDISSEAVINPAKNKPLQMTKKKNFVEVKQDKPIQEVREKAPPKPALISRANTSPIEDFMCNQELEFKPVEKKSLVPERRQAVEKPSGARFEFGRAWKGEPKKNLGRDIQNTEKVKGKRNFQKELREFQAVEIAINDECGHEHLSKIFRLQDEYSVQPGYLARQQKNVGWHERARVVDWMRHVSYEYALARETYHIAIVLLDNYLAKTHNIPRTTLQAVGATTLFVASKIEEFQSKSCAQFVRATNNSCTIKDIHDLEFKILHTLKFRVNPPTLCSLANKIMQQWDIFLDSDAGKQVRQYIAPVYFKQLDENPYRMYRELMQLIDCSIIEVQTSCYKPKMLVCSFMYLLIGRELGIFEKQTIVSEFPHQSRYLLDEGNQYDEYNELFHAFLNTVLGFSLHDILPTVQYCATYFDLPFTYEKPLIEDSPDLENMSLEAYCSYQTFNNSMLRVCKQRWPRR